MRCKRYWLTIFAMSFSGNIFLPTGYGFYVPNFDFSFLHIFKRIILKGQTESLLQRRVRLLTVIVEIEQVTHLRNAFLHCAFLKRYENSIFIRLEVFNTLFCFFKRVRILDVIVTAFMEHTWVFNVVL